jgi:hypothetical protein
MDNETLTLDIAPEVLQHDCMEATEPTLADIVCMQQHLYEQNRQIMQHVAGIENAIRTIAESTQDAMQSLADSPIGGLLSKVMGR